MLKAALFDLDGVVFDTEPQYTEFWGEQCREFRPDISGLEHIIKGQTLIQIYDKYFDIADVRDKITSRLDNFEQQMTFDYITGFVSFLNDLREHSIKTAVVTSSNISKMQSVYRQHPEFKSLFDAILTSEDFEYSKPHPDCYLKAAARFGVDSALCVVFEDSINGLKSGNAANMCVIGLATTNAAEVISNLSNYVISDYSHLTIKKIERIMSHSR